MEEEKKILYAITSGEYSAYGICAITSDKERAERLRKFYSRDGDEAQIEEFIDGDPEAGALTKLEPIYYIYKVAKGEWYGGLYGYTTEKYKNRFKLIDPGYSVHLMSVVYEAYVCAPDIEHATKIAQDKHAQLRAEKYGL